MCGGSLRLVCEIKKIEREKKIRETETQRERERERVFTFFYKKKCTLEKNTAVCDLCRTIKQLQSPNRTVAVTDSVLCVCMRVRASARTRVRACIERESLYLFLQKEVYLGEEHCCM